MLTVVGTLTVGLLMAPRETTGSARRRRERRLRAVLRHERMAVAMALAQKLHHSACRTDLTVKEVVEHVQYNAPRRQKTGSGRARDPRHLRRGARRATAVTSRSVAFRTYPPAQRVVVRRNLRPCADFSTMRCRSWWIWWTC